MKTKAEIEQKLKERTFTMNSQLGKKVCIRASIQADELKWVLE